MQLSAWIFALLPVAALSGWFAGRRSKSTPPTSHSTSYSPDYFKGLNYLLNEQPDQATEIFVKLLDVNSDTVETHLALGNLFRRRGETDRAIRIHQNLIARPNLSKSHRAASLYQLGQDYLSAGLLDRAEQLFQELVTMGSHRTLSLQALVNIYETEKEWPKAIEACMRLKQAGSSNFSRACSHYYCEQAIDQWQQGAEKDAYTSLRLALVEDSRCVRANLLIADFAQRQQHYDKAIAALEAITEQNPVYIVEIIPGLQHCYQHIGQPERLAHYMHTLLQQQGSTSVAVFLSQQMEDVNLTDAVQFMIQHLRQTPSLQGLLRLIELQFQQLSGQARADVGVLRQLIQRLTEQQMGHRCNECGFASQSLHWRCPSCRSWGGIQPTADKEVI